MIDAQVFLEKWCDFPGIFELFCTGISVDYFHSSWTMMAIGPWWTRTRHGGGARRSLRLAAAPVYEIWP
jgi:hypothetical protein